MLGMKIQGLGLVMNKDEYKLNKKELLAGDEIAEHSHPGEEVIFTVVKGIVKVRLNQEENHRLESGDVLCFDGSNSLFAEIVEDALVYVTLIKKA